MSGPLAGIRILEVAGIGPGPFAGMLLADLGAEVIRIDRLERGTMLSLAAREFDLLERSRKSIAVDLKRPEGVELVLELVEGADAIFEGMRPGVAERLGIGPEVCLERNPAIVYGRMTGWGQEGPWAERAGHDMNYLGLTGMQHTMGEAGGPPAIPVNLVADFGGGGMMLAFGLVCALLEARTSGKGQVVDAAMVDGVATLGTMIYGFKAAGLWSESRGTNLLDGGLPFYTTYETADGGHMAVGPIEHQFYAEFLAVLGLDEDPNDQWNRSRFGEMRQKIGEIFKTKTRDEWAARFEGTDACVSPVLSMWEAPDHPHLKARGTFVERDGIVQPAPAPRFSRTPGEITGPPVEAGAHTDDVLESFGFSTDRIAALREAGTVGG